MKYNPLIQTSFFLLSGLILTVYVFIAPLIFFGIFGIFNFGFVDTGVSTCQIAVVETLDSKEFVPICDFAITDKYIAQAYQQGRPQDAQPYLSRWYSFELDAYAFDLHYAWSIEVRGLTPSVKFNLSL